MLKKLTVLFVSFPLLLISCRRETEPDSPVCAAVKITVDNILTSSADISVSSRQDKVVSCIVSAPEEYGTAAPYLDMDAVTRRGYILEHGSEYPLTSPSNFRKMKPQSNYFVGALGLDADGNVITAPVFTTFGTGNMNLLLGGSYNGTASDGSHIFTASIRPDKAVAKYSYVFDPEYVGKSEEELLEILLSDSGDVMTAEGEVEKEIACGSKKVLLAAVPFDIDGNMGKLSTLVLAGQMTLVTVDLGGSVILDSRTDNSRIFEGMVDVSPGPQEFTVTVDGRQYGALAYSGTAGVGTCTGKEFIAYPAVGLNASQDGTRPLTYSVSKSIGRMASVEEGGKKFWTDLSEAGKMLVRVDLSYEDGIPRYYFRLADADNVILHESFDLFAYSGDYLKPANGCAVDSTPDLVDGTEAGVMQAWNMTNDQGANKNEVGYNKTWFDWPNLENGKVLASDLYIKNRDMEGWTLLSCGEKVGAIQLSVSTANAFGVLTTPCLTGISGTDDIILEIDMARFSTSSKNDIAIRVEGAGTFVSGEVTVDGQSTVDLTADVASKNEYRVGYAADICPPSKANGTLDKPVSHFRFSVSGATSATKITVDASVSRNAKGDNSGAARCFVLNLKVTR